LPSSQIPSSLDNIENEDSAQIAHWNWRTMEVGNEAMTLNNKIMLNKNNKLIFTSSPKTSSYTGASIFPSGRRPFLQSLFFLQENGFARGLLEDKAKENVFSDIL
jgi:hypothetical protein